MQLGCIQSCVSICPSTPKPLPAGEALSSVEQVQEPASQRMGSAVGVRVPRGCGVMGMDVSAPTDLRGERVSPTLGQIKSFLQILIW